MCRFRSWLSLSGVLFFLTAPSVSLASWPTDGRAICTASGDQGAPTITPDGAGGGIVAWMDNRSGVTYDYHIYARHIFGSGGLDQAWPADGRALCTASGPTGQYYPEIIGDGVGGAIVTWQDGRTGSNGFWDIYAQHVLASGAVDPAWPANGCALCTATDSQVIPCIASDGAGGAVVAWRDYRNNNSVGFWDIYAQHVLASGAVDPAWPVDGRLLSSPGMAGAPTIASDGAGGAIVAWPGTSYYSDSYVHAQHVLASGGVDPAWPAGYRALSTGSADQANIISDAVGGAIVAWSDNSNGADYDVHAQHVLASGAVDPAWPPYGRLLCSAAGDQLTARIVGDGAEGAVVAWQDRRNGTDYDIYAQHVLAAGAVDPAWPANGRALCTAAGDQSYPRIVGAGTGGAIVVWMDHRNGTNNDIYAHHVLAAGAVDPAWPADGRALCTAAGDQALPRIATDNAGGGIVTWEDARPTANGLEDIYAQRVTGAGAIGTTGVGGVGTPTELAIGRAVPDPARSASTLTFDLPRAAHVSLTAHDLLGRRVRALLVELVPAGRHTVHWDLRDDNGRFVGTGLYFLRLSAEGHSATARLAVVR